MNLVMQLLKQFKVVKYRFLLGLILLLINIIGVQIGPLVIQYIIDNILTHMNGQFNVHLMLQWIGIYLAVIIFSTIVGYIALYILMDCANRIAEHLRNQAYNKIQRLPVSYFDDKPAGKISSRIINDTETLRFQFYYTIVVQVFLNFFPIVIIYSILFTLNKVLFMFLIWLLPLLYFWQRFYQRKTEVAMKDYYEAQSEITTQVNEVMNGSVILQLFKQEEMVTNNFTAISKKFLNAQKSLVHIDSAYSWNIVEVLKRMTYFVILSYIGYQFLGQQLSITTGTIFVLFNYTNRIFDSSGQLVRILPNLQRTLTTGQRVMELLNEEEELDSNEKLIVTDGNVEFKNVYFGYKEDQIVLKNINIVANKGETIALVGHTGSGKSSIINLLFRFYDPQKGQILIDGQDIKQFNRESVRQDMGIVLQDPYLFTGTIATNISMNNENISREQIINALEQVGATQIISKYSKGIDEPVFEKGKSFSSGERQLISFARTLANDPKILILDEATSHIDTQTEEIIQHAMDVVKKGRTTFIIAHRLSTIQNANKIIVLNAGEIIEQGTHEELLKLDGYYANMYKMQSKI